MTPEFLSGGGEMGRRIREYDWSSSALGPVDAWPQSLRTCIRIMLTSQQPIWIGWGEHLINLYNDPYRTILAGKHPSALGAPAAVVWKDIWRQIGPALHRVTHQNEGYYVESQMLIMERNGYPEETYYTFSYTPVPGDDGGTAGMICFNVDDTDRILSERQLRTLTFLGKRLTDCDSYQEALRRTMATLGENAHDFPYVLFYSVTLAGITLTHSTELGESAERVPSTIPPDDQGPLAEAMQRSERERRLQVIGGIEKTLGSMPKGAWDVPPDQAVVIPVFQAGESQAHGFLVMGVNPYRLPDEKFTGFCSLVADQLATSFADIHVLEMERKKAEALAEIDRAKTHFFSNISHEFRTPLTLLLSPIEDVLSDPGSVEVNRYRLGVAHRNALRMQRLVNTLLEFSRIEAGRMEGRYRKVDIATLTKDIASTFRSAVEKAGMELVIVTEEVDDDVYVDTDMWERIILNLVSNAFKYSHRGSIRVEVRQVDGQVQVSVSDTGVGIPEEELEKIFDRFHRVENSGGRSQEGTGIGLAMVRELVRLHQGTISVNSVVGDGSTFTVSLPLGMAHLPADRIVYGEEPTMKQAHAEAFVAEAMKWIPAKEMEESQNGNGHAGRWPADGSADGSGDGQAHGDGQAREDGQAHGDGQADGDGRYTVVLADDNADMREYVGRLLSTEFRVITATDGQDALRKTMKYRPDLLLSDVMMPRLDGFGLLKRIRQTPGLQHIPIILLSARAGEEAKVEGLASGADDYLIKPFSARELLARVESNIRIAKERTAVITAYAEKLEDEVQRRTEELTRVNRSLEQSNEDLQQFAHVASHDLKEPVRKIRTYAGRVLEEYGSMLNPEARVFLVKIQQATARMAAMIEGVLAYSMLKANEQPAVPVDLNEVFNNIESDLELLLHDRNAIIRREKLPVIEGAPVLLYQLFYNIVGNALKFSKKDNSPLITIASRVIEEVGKQIALFTITDNGIGFDQQQSGRIFEAFTRLNSKDKYEGTGLGLALCRKIVERHHGTISATGVSGVGAVFVVKLPVRQMERSI
ncbi:MAG TPA: ATP-binding protein [Puia sp.]|nr:ATP-binding protein [Puia sp.]